MASGLMMVKLGLAVAFFLCVAIGRPRAEAAMTCGQVTSGLAACVGYLSQGGEPSSGCCAGVRNLNTAAKTTADRQTVCYCLLQVVKELPVNSTNIANAAALPGKCGVNLPYKISPDIRCSTIKM